MQGTTWEGRQPRAQMLAVTLPGTFVSVGVALGASGAAAAAVPLGWHGTLLGPPVMAVGASHFGWPGGAAAATTAALPALPLAWRAVRGL